uniref:Fibulin-1 n=1 Tax=Eptatretus burgeri TaxID=7764 RepID=A0A8C4WX85_EPTBU
MSMNFRHRFEIAFLQLLLTGMTVVVTSPVDSLQHCCDYGRSWAKDKDNCNSIQLLQNNTIDWACSKMQERCCMEQISEALCQAGKVAANNSTSCVSISHPGCPKGPFEMCCECCKLGKKSREHGLPCQSPQGLGPDCASTFVSCCLDKTVSGVQNEWDEWTFIGNDTELCTKGLKCSHICKRINDHLCSCKPGFSLLADGVTCADIDECKTDGSTLCPGSQKCLNTAGSYYCQPICVLGYIADRVRGCVDQDECLTHKHTCSPEEYCVNTIGSFRCERENFVCVGGLQLAEENKCVDIDECKTGTHRCGIGKRCQNTHGSYHCLTDDLLCQLGFYLSDTGSCDDIDECVQYSGRLCAHLCKNTYGSYSCSCTQGFKLSLDKHHCDDIDECQGHPCNQECINVHGSYQCYCRRGFRLSETDGSTCTDINECTLFGERQCLYECVNTLGSYRCRCPPGYDRSLDGRLCNDIDECAMQSHNCSTYQTCLNVGGGFRCLSLSCPVNYKAIQSREGKISSSLLRCIQQGCDPADIYCEVDSVKDISHTTLTLASQPTLKAPLEVMYVRVPRVSTPHLPSLDVVFRIVEGNDRAIFDIINTREANFLAGKLRIRQAVQGPYATRLKVVLDFYRAGNLTHRNVIYIHVFVSSYAF